MADTEDTKKSPDGRLISDDVWQHFLFLSPDEFLVSFEPFLEDEWLYAARFSVAREGLSSVISAAGMPLELVIASIKQRRFDRFHMAERIRAIPTPDTPELMKMIEAQELNKEPSSRNLVAALPPDAEEKAIASAFEKMREFWTSEEGKRFLANGIQHELKASLELKTIRSASQEVLVQTLISSWSVFEHFSKTFIVDWLNSNPGCAGSVSDAPELKEFFGKQVVDISVLGNHAFDLSKSMGTILFSERRVDSLSVIRAVFKALFSSSTVQTALGEKLWMLNQQRHLFVHKRGIVDADYLGKTSSSEQKGERLTLTSDNIVDHLMAVREAIVAIGEAASKGKR